MTPKALEEFLFPLCRPMTAIWAFQNGERPKKPYVSFNATTHSGGPIHYLGVDAQGMANYAEHRTIAVEMNVYGVDAVETAQRIAMLMRSHLNVAKADALGLGLGQFQQVRRIPQLLQGSQYEERAILEFTAFVVGQVSEDVGLIEHVVMDCFSDHEHVISKPDAATPPPVLTE